MSAWRVSGSYFEACNCDAICPCRWQGGAKQRPGSTYGVCDFALSWSIVNGHAGDVDLSALSVVMAGSYRDDEPGKPWRVTIYVDERADAPRRQLAADIFLGRMGGTTRRNFAQRIVEVHAIRAARIELDHRPQRWFFRAENMVEVRYRSAIEQPLAVTCGIPGHDRPGEEIVADLLRVDDAPLTFEVHGKCGFASDFDYQSDGDAA